MKLYHWEKENNMDFNSSKFELLRGGKNKKTKDETKYDIPQNEEVLKKCHKKPLYYNE